MTSQPVPVLIEGEDPPSIYSHCREQSPAIDRPRHGWSDPRVSHLEDPVIVKYEPIHALERRSAVATAVISTGSPASYACGARGLPFKKARYLSGKLDGRPSALIRTCVVSPVAIKAPSSR